MPKSRSPWGRLAEWKGFLKQHRNRNIMLFLTIVRFKCHTQSNEQALKRNYNRVRPLICFRLSGPAQLLPLL